MKQSYPHIIRSGSTVTIEARTMAEADAAAERELGPGFTVTSVRRLRKGGLGGFFALELVELVATTEPAASAGSAPDMASAEDLIRSLQRHEGDFAARLLDRMGDVDPDAITMQELFSSARAAGLPTDGLWEEALGVTPRPAGDTRAQLADVLDAPTFTGTAAPTTNELPTVADAIGPDPMATDGPPLQRRRPRPADPAGPLAEMPPPPLRFDDEAGSWTVADAPPDALPDHPAFPEAAIATALPATGLPADGPTSGAPVPADTWRVETAPPTPTPPAPAIAAPVAPPATASVPPPPPPTPLPPPPAAPTGWDAPVVAAAPTATAPPVPSGAAPATPPAAEAASPVVVAAEPAPTPAVTGPTLAEMGWRIDVDTPEPVVGPVDLGPALPLAPAPPVDGPVAIAALDALPEVSGPVVNARPEGPDAVASRDGATVVLAQPGAVLPARAARPAVDADPGLPAVHVSVPGDTDRPGPAAADAADADAPADEPASVAVADDLAPVAETPAEPDRGTGPVDELPLSFGTERPSIFRPMGLESLRSPRRSGLPWRSRSARAADEALPGTVPAFAPPPVRTPVTEADRGDAVDPATIEDRRPEPEDVTPDDVTGDVTPEHASFDDLTPDDVAPDVVTPDDVSFDDVAPEPVAAPPAPVDDVTTTGTDGPDADDGRADTVELTTVAGAADAVPAVETVDQPVAGPALPPVVAEVPAPPAPVEIPVAVAAAPVPAEPVPAVAAEPAPVVEPPARPAPLTLGSLVPDVPAVPVDAPSTGSGWSSQALFALGLPDRLVHTAAALAPRDDAEWTAALLLALRPLFGPLPEGPMLLAGPLVDVVAEELGAELVEPGATSTAPLIALATDDPGEVAATLAGRSLHLVVGGMWHELARLRPAVVSTAGPRFLLPAVTVAHAWGAPLGVMAGVTTVRLDAVKVAMEIRATLGLDLEDGPGAGRRLFTNP